MRRLALLCLALVGALLLAGCGNRQELYLAGETEGRYIDLGGLRYQIQISRQLNPALIEDRDYFRGIEPGVGPATRDQTWFGIFIRVQNTSDQPRDVTTLFEVVDTEERRYEPVLIDPQENPFAYEPRTIEPGGLLPAPDSVAYDGPTQGELLLFKISNESLQNRPLEFVIRSSQSDEEGVVDLDV